MNKKKFSATLLAAFMAVLPLMAQQNGMKIDYLGNNTVLVRLDTPKPYLLLPIEEEAPEATVNIIVGGRIDQQANIRLAESKVDYYVPFIISDYKGQKVLLDIRTNNDRSHVRDYKENVCWQGMRLADAIDSTNVEKYRPAYQHTPVYGWMNDPNGMFYKDGRYHLYFQYNPYGSMWGNMTWGHSSTTDLVHWEHHPVAVRPDALGTVFSGNTVVDHENTAGFGRGAVVGLYTSAGVTQQQSLIYSTDNGMTFHKYEGNPVIVSDKERRDDNMFWDQHTQRWVMVLADALERQDLIFSSPDMKNWTLESSFGKGYGAQEGVWECPDLFELSIEGSSKKKWVLVVNINPGGPFGGSATQYFVGEFDGKTFRADTKPEVTKWLDYGKDHYATVSWSNAPDGRRIVLGWMSNWQYAGVVPTKQFRSANTLPRDLSLFRADDGTYSVKVMPSKEVDALRGSLSRLGGFKVGSQPVQKTLPKGGLYEIDIDLGMAKGQQLDITLANDKGEKVVMTYDTERATFGMDRTKSGMVDFSRDFPAVTVAPMQKGTSRTLRLFVDRSSIEAFDGEGRFAMTNLVFPTDTYTTIAFSSRQKTATVKALNVYTINP